MTGRGDPRPAFRADHDGHGPTLIDRLLLKLRNREVGIPDRLHVLDQVLCKVCVPNVFIIFLQVSVVYYGMLRRFCDTRHLKVNYQAASIHEACGKDLKTSGSHDLGLYTLEAYLFLQLGIGFGPGQTKPTHPLLDQRHSVCYKSWYDRRVSLISLEDSSISWIHCRLWFGQHGFQVLFCLDLDPKYHR